MKVWILLAAGLLAGCGADAIEGPQLQRGGKTAFNCTDMGEPEPGCPVSWSALEGSEEIATPAGSADGSEPLWLGEPASSFSESALTCPQTIAAATNKAYIIEFGEDAYFRVTGLVKHANLGYSVYGSPMASYRVPPGAIRSYSPLDKYEMIGGLMYARCNIVIVRTGLGVRVELGPITWYNYDGSIFLSSLPPRPGEDEGRGWGFRNSGTGSTTYGGTPTGVLLSALAKYDSGGGCTKGVEIWIDGWQVCDAYGNQWG
jgi:hypothetical protein